MFTLSLHFHLIYTPARLLHHEIKSNITTCSLSQRCSYNVSDTVLYYVMAAITHTVCPLPDLIIFKEWRRFSRRAQPGDATPHASLMKKTRERERESANYFTCSTGNKLWGVRWKTATLSSLRTRRYTDFGTSEGCCPFEVGEGTWWVSLIPGRRTDTLYKGGWDRSKLGLKSSMTPHTGGQLKAEHVRCRTGVELNAMSAAVMNDNTSSVASTDYYKTVCWIPAPSI